MKLLILQNLYSHFYFFSSGPDIFPNLWSSISTSDQTSGASHAPPPKKEVNVVFLDSFS